MGIDLAQDGKARAFYAVSSTIQTGDSTCAMHGLSPGSAVYHGTQYAVNAISEGLRQEHAGRLHVTVVSPDVHGPIDPLAERIAASYARERMRTNRRIAVPVDAVARSIAGAIEGYGYGIAPARTGYRPKPRPAEYAQ